ncbi:MAG: hypothetical protein JJU11_00275 [Candidatus Sumerlaeia bacterium]|nr:hypothetical protein [Candidatus Sumerlaeia bacterium]
MIDQPLEILHSNCLWDGERVIAEYRKPFDLIALALAGEKENGLWRDR